MAGGSKNEISQPIKTLRGKIMEKLPPSGNAVIDRLYEMISALTAGKVKLPEVSISLDAKSIWYIVLGIGALFLLMFVGVYFLIKSTIGK